MKSILLRFWQWLGRLLGQNIGGARDEYRANGDEARSEMAAPARPQPPMLQPPPGPAVELPPPLPPQFDIHANENARFVRKPSILTNREHQFYQSLRRDTGDEFQIMSKVRLWDFIRLANEPAERKRHLDRLSCRHVDFLLCHPSSLKPLLVIELDDQSHQNAYTQASDKYKNDLFAHVGLPILREQYHTISPRLLRQHIDHALNNDATIPNP